MKSIKIILLSAITAAMLTSCGMNTARNGNNSASTAVVSPAPTADTSGNVSNTDNGRVEEDKSGTTAADMTGKAGNAVSEAGDAAGNVIEDAGEIAGDAVQGAGDMAQDAIDGAGDAAGINDNNNNGR